MSSEFHIVMEDLFDISLLPDFCPNVEQKSIATAIAVTISKSGAIKRWKVLTNSNEVLEITIPSAKFANVKNYSLCFTMNIKEINWNTNSCTSPFVSIREMLRKERASIISSESGDPVETAEFLNNWKSDCCLRFSIDADIGGSGLVLQVYCLQATVDTLMSKPLLGGDNCPGVLLYSVPVEAEFVMTTDYQGPKLTFFSENVQAVRDLIETSPEIIASGCNMLLQKIVQREFLENSSSEAKFLKNPRSHQGIFPFFSKLDSCVNKRRKKAVNIDLAEDSATILSKERLHTNFEFQNNQLQKDPILLPDVTSANFANESNLSTDKLAQSSLANPSDLSTLKSLLPNLGQFSEEFLSKNNIDTLIKLSNLNNVNDNSSRSLELKMDSNSNLRNKPRIIEPTPDNGADILHEVRFFPAPACSLKTLTKIAKEKLSKSKILPASDYDLNSYGLHSSITPRGWWEIHNPESRAIQIKLFSMKNNNNSTRSAARLALSDDSVTIGEAFKEILSHNELRAAMWALTVSMSYARPWDRSAQLMFTFYLSTNFLQGDLPAGMAANFLDEILSGNRSRFMSGEAPFSVSELHHELWAFKTRHFAKFPNMSNLQNLPRKDSARQFFNQKPQQGKQISKVLPPEPCKRYNVGQCSNNKNNCSLRTSKGLLPLHHVCNVVLSNGMMCKKEHPASNHM